mmetsp:Transcript_38189/g.96705  ORF Transcript_38189/g.96705 Transcript_38189/m.96705 type:complete len:230 (-) Transcript_38189:594-1283(-)
MCPAQATARPISGCASVPGRLTGLAATAARGSDDAVGAAFWASRHSPVSPGLGGRVTRKCSMPRVSSRHTRLWCSGPTCMVATPSTRVVADPPGSARGCATSCASADADVCRASTATDCGDTEAPALCDIPNSSEGVPSARRLSGSSGTSARRSSSGSPCAATLLLLIRDALANCRPSAVRRIRSSGAAPLLLLLLPRLPKHAMSSPMLGEKVSARPGPGGAPPGIASS